MSLTSRTWRSTGDQIRQAHCNVLSSGLKCYVYCHTLFVTMEPQLHNYLDLDTLCVHLPVPIQRLTSELDQSNSERHRLLREADGLLQRAEVLGRNLQEVEGQKSALETQLSSTTSQFKHAREKATESIKRCAHSVCVCVCVCMCVCMCVCVCVCVCVVCYFPYSLYVCVHMCAESH